MALVASSTGRHRETEVKIAVTDLRALRRRLKALGFVPAHLRSLEDNILFDTPERTLRQVRSVLRIRRYGPSWSVTFKGTPESDRYYKSRLELESKVTAPQAIEGVFRALGLGPVFRYQKYRTQYILAKEKGHPKQSIEVALDETPIGDFIEVEGSRRSIDRVARALGYSRSDYNTASYGALYVQDCVKRNVPASDMIFATPARWTVRKKPSAARRHSAA